VFKTVDFCLKQYTLHYQIIRVPSLIGLDLSSAKETLKQHDLDFIIIDSAAYNPDYDRGAILSHTPKSGSEVKPNRKIYLTINPLTVHYIAFPQLINKSLRQSISLLENNAFRIGHLYYVDYFAKDVVRFAKTDNKEVEFNDSLPKFSVIDLYLGNGYEKTVIVPNVIGFKIKQVKRRLNNYSLNLGDINIIDSNDSLSMIIYQQDPQFNTKVTIGSFISVWGKDTVFNN